MPNPKPRKSRSIDDDNNVCPECKGHIVTDFDAGERFCEQCGYLVEEQMINNGQEYRLFDEQHHKNRKRVGPPETETLHDRGLATQISPKMKDSQGHPIPANSRRDVHRLIKTNHKSHISNSQERNLVFALVEINKIASQLQLPIDVRNETAHLYRRAVSENIIRGRSISSVIASSFYLATRMHGNPCPIEEISKAVGVSRKECGRIFRFMKRKFKIFVAPPVANNFLDRTLQKLNTSPETTTHARVIMSQCADKGLYSGKAPMSLVAAVIAIAVDKSGDKMKQKDIADKCGITEVTLRNRVKDILERSVCNETATSK